MAGAKVPNELQPWIEARKRFRLSNAQVQMARALGMNPRKLGKLAGGQQPWKLPLPLFIEECYRKRFGRDRPARVLSIEEMAAQDARKRAKRKAHKRLEREAAGSVPAAAPESQESAGR